MNLSTFRLLSVAAVVLIASACGNGKSADPLVGTYVLDVDRTLAARGSEKPNEATLAAVRLDFAPAAYRFQVLEDGTFVLTVGTAGDPFTMQGTWERSGAAVGLTTTQVNGEPLGEDAGTASIVCRTEGDALVLTADGQDLFLRRV